MLKRPSDGFWAGLVVGIVVVTVLMFCHVDINGGGDRPPPAQTVQTSDAAALAFVAAWQKMANGSWAVDSAFSRVTNTGRRYEVTVRNVQRPPDYVNQAPTAVSASVGGRLYACASANTGAVAGCRDYGPAPAFSSYAQSRVQVVQRLVGQSGSYGVEADQSGCYQLYLNPGQTPYNWGNRARFCFDPTSGALVLTAITTDTSVDTTQATKVVVPTDADFHVPQIQ